MLLLFSITYLESFFLLSYYIIGKYLSFAFCILPAPSSKTSEREDACSYRINFKVTKLLSIRRSDPKLAWPYAVFILKDGTTQPALHFHSGGITSMISRLQRYIWLTRSVCYPVLCIRSMIRNFKMLHFLYYIMLYFSIMYNVELCSSL